MWNIRRKKKKEGSNPLMTIVVVSIYGLVALGKYIMEKGYLIYIIFFIILGIIVYIRIMIQIQKLKEKPVSLGKEFEAKYPIIIQYTPPKGINPAEAGLLYNCKVDPTDLTSLIYQWTLEGLISIKNISGKDSNHIDKIELVKLNDIPSSRPFFERDIFASIFFKGKQKTITYSSQLKYALLLEDLEMHGVEKGWVYRPKSAKLRKILYSILVGLLILSFIMIFRLNNFEGYTMWMGISLVLLFACIFLGGYIFGGKPLKLTDKGAELASHIIGYRNFIKSCDESKIRLLLEQDPLFIDKTVPYATAFGIETEFIKKISPMKKDFYGKSSGLYEKNGNLSSLILYLLKN